MSRQRAVGTAAETAACRYAQDYGFPHAERRALRGRLDRGDLLLTAGCIAEVKGGATAETASDNLIGAWMAETERERVNANAAVALLVVKRRAIGHGRAGQWACWMQVGTVAHLMSVIPLLGAVALSLETRAQVLSTPVRLTYHDALTLLRAAGYGSPLEETR